MELLLIQHSEYIFQADSVILENVGFFLWSTDPFILDNITFFLWGAYGFSCVRVVCCGSRRR